MNSYMSVRKTNAVVLKSVVFTRMRFRFGMVSKSHKQSRGRAVGVLTASEYRI
jgi:hypothetical protein